MSASAIAASRLRHQDYRDDHQQRLPPLGLLEQARLRNALLANDSGALALPEQAVFEPLLAVGIEQSLDATAAASFTSHTAFVLPRVGSNETDVLHRFCVRTEDRATANMTEGLKRFALHKERRARKSDEKPENRLGRSGDLPDAADRSAAGVAVSNVGGFQSYPDLFDYNDLLEQEAASKRGAPGALRQAARRGTAGGRFELNALGDAEFSQADVDGRRHCHELLRIARVAIADLEMTSRQDEEPELPSKATSQISHRANAWLNVSRAADFNVMHVHQADRWSGTFYVSGSPASDQTLDGRLVFRTGPKPRAQAIAGPGAVSGAASGVASGAAATHAYHCVPPVPGTLWLFPGSVPHRVLGMLGACNQNNYVDVTRGMWAPRISIAFNFLDASMIPASTLRKSPSRTV